MPKDVCVQIHFCPQPALHQPKFPHPSVTWPNAHPPLISSHMSSPLMYQKCREKERWREQSSLGLTCGSNQNMERWYDKQIEGGITNDQVLMSNLNICTQQKRWLHTGSLVTDDRDQWSYYCSLHLPVLLPKASTTYLNPDWSKSCLSTAQTLLN